MKISPFGVICIIVLIVLAKLITEFSKAAASEAGKSLGKRLGAILARRAEARFGIGGTLGVLVLILVTMSVAGYGALLALTAPDCETENAGYTLIGTSTGFWV